MNGQRVWRVTILFLLISGCQLYNYNPKKQRHRFCLFGIVNFIGLMLFYGACFTHHFEKSAFLQLLEVVSPFLCRLIRLHLLLGIKLLICGLYESRLVIRAANGISELLLQRTFPKKCSRVEAQAYVYLFSTLLIFLGFCLYVAYEMDFTLPPIDPIFLAMGLFIPHYILAGALRLSLIGTFLMTTELKGLFQEFQFLIGSDGEHDNGTEKVLNGDIKIGFVNSVVCDKELILGLSKLHSQIEKLHIQCKLFYKAVQSQITFLVVLNSISLLAGVYCHIYFEDSWYILLVGSYKRIFTACNLGLFVFIGWDYLCVCYCQVTFAKVKSQFLEEISLTFKCKRQYTKCIRGNFKYIREILNSQGWQLNLFGKWPIIISNFIVLHTFVGIIIGVIMVYQYLNDKILLLSNA